jgi:hypothetical protein
MRPGRALDVQGAIIHAAWPALPCRPRPEQATDNHATLLAAGFPTSQEFLLSGNNGKLVFENKESDVVVLIYLKISAIFYSEKKYYIRKLVLINFLY